MLMASGLDLNAAVNISADCCNAVLAWRRFCATRRCFSFVRMRRARETENEAVIAAHARVLSSDAIRRPINSTSKGMQTGNAREKIEVFSGESDCFSGAA